MGNMSFTACDTPARKLCFRPPTPDGCFELLLADCSSGCPGWQLGESEAAARIMLAAWLDEAMPEAPTIELQRGDKSVLVRLEPTDPLWSRMVGFLASCCTHGGSAEPIPE